jgi:ABC-type Fe3+-hydroxamate transport system substrate-binding protein
MCLGVAAPRELPARLKASEASEASEMRMVRDALGRELRIERPPSRIVSLVPSETESVAALGGLARLVGRTEYCEEPAGAIEAVPTVGGTKKIDVRAVLALHPDLVLANKEENSRRDVEALMAAGLPVHVSFPCTVEETFSYLGSLVRLLHAPESVERSVKDAAASLARDGDSDYIVPVFVPIWREPWMTFDARTYASDLLARAGGANVFAERARRFPLAADLDGAEPHDPGERDTRYPRISLTEVVARAPRVVLLPDEPYAFTDAHARELHEQGVDADVVCVSGKDLFWYGTRTIGALGRLRALLDRHRR